MVYFWCNAVQKFQTPSACPVQKILYFHTIISSEVSQLPSLFHVIYLTLTKPCMFLQLLMWCRIQVMKACKLSSSHTESSTSVGGKKGKQNWCVCFWQQQQENGVFSLSSDIHPEWTKTLFRPNSLYPDISRLWPDQFQMDCRVHLKCVSSEQFWWDFASLFTSDCSCGETDHSKQIKAFVMFSEFWIGK